MPSVSRVNALSLDSTVLASPQQVSCSVAGEAVVLSMRDGEYYGLNEVGSSIWQLIQQPRTLREVRDSLLEEYLGIDPHECEHAVLAFVTELLSLSLAELT